MKLKDLWKLSLDNEWKMGLRSFFNTVLYIIGMTVIGIMVYLISMDADAKKSMDKSLRKGLNHSDMPIASYYRMIIQKIIIFIYRK